MDYQFTWAEDFTAVRPVAQSAADFIVETLRRHPGEITLLAVGPLQNIADALRKEPNLGSLAKRVVLMSGSIGGNVWSPTPVAEWNVVRATSDAQLVYSSAAADDRAARFDQLREAQGRRAHASSRSTRPQSREPWKRCTGYGLATRRSR